MKHAFERVLCFFTVTSGHISTVHSPAFLYLLPVGSGELSAYSLNKPSTFSLGVFYQTGLNPQGSTWHFPPTFTIFLLESHLLLHKTRRVGAPVLL